MAGDNAMGATPTATPAPSQQSTANSKCPSPSSEEIKVRLLQAKVDEAAAAGKALKERVSGIWRMKQEYDNESADLKSDLDSKKAEIKGLWAVRRKAEDAVKRNRDFQDDPTHEIKLIHEKSTAKWEEGKAAKRNVDEAARNLQSLEKELKKPESRRSLFAYTRTQGYVHLRSMLCRTKNTLDS